MLRVRLRGPTAFTLVELLVVVSIITLLLGILLPSLSEAREKARLAKCLANLHQLGNTMHTYFAEYADTFPWFSALEYRAGRLDHQTWYYGGRYPEYHIDPHIRAETKFYPEERPFNRYLYRHARGPKADLKLYRCPSEKPYWFWPGGEAVCYKAVGTSYIHNYVWAIQSGAGNTATHLSILPDYANKLVRYKLIVRGSGTFAMLVTPHLNEMAVRETRVVGNHGRLGFSEVLFLDGHAAHFLTDTSSRNWRTKTAEWTLWFSEPLNAIPDQFRWPFPGMEEYEP
jgi:competence protein ComGC